MTWAMFGFAYAKKENAQCFLPMTVMYATPLRRGFARGGITRLFNAGDTAAGFSDQQDFPGIRIILQRRCGGTDHYLYRRASWICSNCDHGLRLYAERKASGCRAKLIGEQFL